MEKNEKFTLGYRNAANLNAESSFPYFVRTAENQIFSAGDVGFGVFHWHEDLQFIYVLEGSACVKTLEEEVIIQAGEGVFTNSGVIHYSISKSKPCSYRLFRFPERFLNFYGGSPAEEMTRRVTDNSGIELIPLIKSEQWCNDTLPLLQQLVKLEEGKERNQMYPYDVLATLSQIWQVILHHIEIPQKTADDPISIRMRAFLEFIENNYEDDITLEMLAASAGVSKTEALRCFRQRLQTTPYRYLIDVRLSKAAELLLQTGLPVGEIAERAGFHQQSYFGKRFREKTGMTPLEYRGDRARDIE